MDVSKQNLKVSMLFCFKLGGNVTEATEIINFAWGDNYVGAWTVWKRFSRFRVENFNLQDNPRLDPEKKFEDEELQALLNETHVRLNKNLENNYGLLRLQFQIDYMQLERFRRKENGFPIC